MTRRHSALIRKRSAANLKSKRPHRRGSAPHGEVPLCRSPLPNSVNAARVLGLDRVTASRLLQAADQSPLDSLERSSNDHDVLQLIDHFRTPLSTDLPAELAGFV